MTTEVKKACDGIKDIQHSLVEVSGKYLDCSPFKGANRILELVVDALNAGATVNDFTPLVDTTRKAALQARYTHIVDNRTTLLNYTARKDLE